VVAVPDVLDFDAVREAASESWDRADPEAALIEQHATRPNVWKVTMADSSDVYLCRYEKEHGAYVGHCECKGWHYNRPSPCVHLCTLRQAEFVGAPRAADARGQPVRAVDVDEQRTQVRGDVDRAMTDGGRRGERR
jgi:hypothetical protein